MSPHAAGAVWDAGEIIVELTDGIAPDYGVTGLVAKAEENVIEALGINLVPK